MKKFTPKAGIFLIYSFLSIAILMIICALWLILGVHGLTISFTIISGLGLLVFVPICIKASLNTGSIVINDQKIIYFEMITDKKINYSLQAIEIAKIQNVKVVYRDEIKKYYKDWKAKKILLLDLGDEGYKHIIVTLFSKKQVHDIIDTINARRKILKTTDGNL